MFLNLIWSDSVTLWEVIFEISVTSFCEVALNICFKILLWNGHTNNAIDYFI